MTRKNLVFLKIILAHSLVHYSFNQLCASLFIPEQYLRTKVLFADKGKVMDKGKHGNCCISYDKDKKKLRYKQRGLKRNL